MEKLLQAKSPGASSAPRGTGVTVVLGLIAVVLLFGASGLVSYLNTRSINDNAESVTHTHDILKSLDDVLSLLKDAETGQRGFIITGKEQYLDPYKEAVSRVYAALAEAGRLSREIPGQQARLEALKAPLDTKLAELAETIRVRRENGLETASAVVLEDRGKTAMDQIRQQISVMAQAVETDRLERIAKMNAAFAVATVSGMIACAVGMLLSGIVASLVYRNLLSRRRQEWLQAGQLRLASALEGDKRTDELGASLLAFFNDYLGAQAGAFFVRDATRFRRAATFGVPAAGGTPTEFETNDGLLGQAVKSGKAFMLSNVPDGYIQMGSAFGRTKPRHLVIVPMKQDGVVNSVAELGFLDAPKQDVLELLARGADAAGIAVRSANYRSNLQNYLEETQRQAEELQVQGEELRVSNEELEEQSRALRESQVRLELQQAELEQTNAQLEEQNQLLETQRDDIARSNAALATKSKELETASRYKSDFLANMSHELRTPLNSTLILAKLLADNGGGNLNDEQVRYAQTILAAGNDLLTLINDILDLSKIEAGHMEVHPEAVRIVDLVDSTTRMFEPIAEQKSLAFLIDIDPSCPDSMVTDPQRLQQILKNLLSNALKFTEHGEVSLRVQPKDDSRLEFAVHDTGIGIGPNEQDVVFEAFRQADGTTNRKHGGTGLGLSIARELARLLGGDIRLDSESGKGSVFTVTVPVSYHPSLVKERQAPKPVSAQRAEPLAHAAMARPGSRNPKRIDDDRLTLTGSARTILVIEDDEPFARIIYDLAHEMSFQCIIAQTAEEGLAAAVQHRPSAVVLDIGLPDHSGLTVLDHLKHDARTRHIPVHVVSAHDHAETALSLGAIGYMMKPVQREQLEDAFKKLEDRLEQRLRRVLIVEDDPVQLESVRKLLQVHDVTTQGAANAAECLDKLRSETFDCMVLDLSLPDSSGYALLETLSREDCYSFPPVIVYTGHDLSAQEEERLRRYSKSIIIKGAKSPERLLDEVTLFLHQVVAELPPEQQKMLERARGRDAMLEGKRILIVEDDVRNIFALTSVLEPRGAIVAIARNGREALTALEQSLADPSAAIDLVLMDIMMPEMDGITATQEIRKRHEWRKLPIIALTAKAMKNDQEQCRAAGANDYLAKPLDVEKLLSLIRVWMPR
ncbi:MAG: response regulator [Bdellovibrionota bacterium]